MERRMKEVIRYLGYGNHAVEAQTLEMIESSLLELEEISDKFSIIFAAISGLFIE